MLSHLPVDGRGRNPDEGPNQGPASAQKRNRMVRIGVALFDSDAEMGSGWACLSGEYAFRFGSVHELTNEALWVTNLKFDVYRLHASKFAHLRRIDFLKTPLYQIGADIGMRLDGGNAEKAAAALATIAQDAVRIAVKVYQWDEPLTNIREDTLADDIKRGLGQAPVSKGNVKSAMTTAYQNYSSPSWAGQYETDCVTLTMRYNRVRYGRYLLSQPVPDEAWTLISGSGSQDLSLDRLLNPEEPCVVEAGIEFGAVDPALASLMSFGVSVGRRTGIRKWVSQPELAWLCRYARVTISSALVSRGSRPLPDTARFPDALTSDPLFEHSISAGLIAECHWSALAAPNYNKMTRMSEANAWATWIRAHDRAASFDLALRAHEAGLLVIGYGNGSITLRVGRDRLQECLAFAEGNAIAHPAFYPLFIQHGRRDLVGDDLGLL